MSRPPSYDSAGLIGPHGSLSEGRPLGADKPLGGPPVAHALLQALEDSDDSVIVADASGAIQWANRSFLRMTGQGLREIIGRGIAQALRGTSGEGGAAPKGIADAMRDGTRWTGELLQRRSDGTTFWHELDWSPVRTSDVITSWVLIGRDVTSRKSLARRFLQLSAVVEASIDGIAMIDEQQEIKFANSAFAHLYGLGNGASLTGMSWRTFYSEEQLRVFDSEILPQLYTSDAWHGEAEGLRPDGTTFPQELTVALLSGGYAMVVRDISDRKAIEAEQERLNEALRLMSISDQLTGLYNRRGFMLLAQQQLHAARRQEGHTILLYMDLNDFKPINDSLGHAVGDQALVEVADVLRETFREGDVIGRLGGDEFVVLAVNSLDHTGDRLVERLERRLASRNARAERNYALSLSCGVAVFGSQDSESLEQLLAVADAKLYEKKRLRRTALIPEALPEPEAR